MHSADPNGKQVPFQKSTLRGQTYTITANEVGEHIIQVMVNNQQIKGSPFRSQAYDAKAIQVENIPDGVVNQPVEFESELCLSFSLKETVHENDDMFLCDLLLIIIWFFIT